MRKLFLLLALPALLATGYSKDNTEPDNNHSKHNGDVYSPDGMDMVYVEGKGSGVFGTPSFYIGQYEVTQAQWIAIMGTNPSNFQGDNLPVEQVSWDDVQEFIAKLNAATGRNYRLPTEAEWEYAASGGTAGHGYTYSGSNDINTVAWYYDNSGLRTHNVGTKAPNELGIYDMSGNVWEWCSDWYDNTQQYRVLRGGGWSSTAEICAVSSRHCSTPDDRSDGLGFRLVLP